MWIPCHLSLVCLLCVGLLATGAQAYPVPSKPPPFSLSTVPVFAHITKRSPFNATDLAFLAKFSLVTFDKGQDESQGGSVEDSFIAAAKQLKAVAPHVATLFYMNGLINFPIFWKIFNTTQAAPHDYLLYNTKGEPVQTLKPYTTFDMTLPAMRKLFVSDCQYALQSGVFNGCFVDRANFALLVQQKFHGVHTGGWDVPTTRRTVAAQDTLLTELQTVVGAGALVLAKETGDLTPMGDWRETNTLMLTDTFCSTYNGGPYDADQCQLDIAALRNASKRGQVTECHGVGALDDVKQREFTLACFLVGVGKYSYFEYASMESGLAWQLDGTRWWPEYDKPLGEPLGDALYQPTADSWVYTRSFASGTKVWVDVKNHKANIQWASQ